MSATRGAPIDKPLRIRRLLPAPPSDVYSAWTDPESLRDWLSPVGHAEAEVDLRVGGSFRIVMVGDGHRVEHTGEYLELTPPERLVFTWSSPYTGPEPSVVTVELRSHDTGTELLLTHERLPEGAADSHGRGWGAMLERLAALLAAEAKGPAR